MAREEAEEAEARRDEGKRKKMGIIIANLNVIQLKKKVLQVVI